MKKLVAFAIVCALLNSCRKKDPTPAAETPDPNGTISGKVTVIDQYGIAQTSGLNTVTVTIEGKNYSAITDADGNYTMSDVAPGTYNISFRRAGAGLWQKQQVSFAGNGVFTQNGYSVEKPTYTFTGRIFDSVITTPFPTERIYVHLNMTPMHSAHGVLIIRGNSPNLDIADPTSYTNVYQNSIPIDTATALIFFDYPVTGTHYYKAYPFPDIYNGPFYDDVPLDKRRYTAYGTQVPGTFTVTH
jgi:hypothetical protein